MDFLTGQRLIYTSEQYATIYDHFRENVGIKLGELFMMAMTIGFYHSKKSERMGKGREFRSNYLSTQERSAAYTMILTDPELGKRIDQFEDSQFQTDAVHMMEEYAEAGMDILTEEVFMNKWDGNTLDKTYTEYEVDILSYISQLIDDTPF